MTARSRYIRKVRTDRRLSYEQVAETMGVNPVTVRNWEKHGCKPLVEFAYRWRYRHEIVAPRFQMPDII